MAFFDAFFAALFFAVLFFADFFAGPPCAGSWPACSGSRGCDAAFFLAAFLAGFSSPGPSASFPPVPAVSFSAAAAVDPSDAVPGTAVFFVTMAAAPSHIVILHANRAGTINRPQPRGNGARRRFAPPHDVLVTRLQRLCPAPRPVIRPRTASGTPSAPTGHSGQAPSREQTGRPSPVRARTLARSERHRRDE